MTGMLSIMTAREASSARVAARATMIGAGADPVAEVVLETTGFPTDPVAFTAEAIPPDNDRTASRPAFRASETTFDPIDFLLTGRGRWAFLEGLV